jgi:TetR/AcrR family transcriptional regulator of autoinduction and epiphytic fitness
MAVRKTRSVVQKREVIAFAAADVFARKGFRATTMQEIAGASGYTAASLYTYFKSKEEIFEALFRALMSEFLATFEAPLPTGASFAQRLELLLWAQLSLAEKRREAFAMFHTGAPEVACIGKDAGRLDLDRRMVRWIRANATAADIGGNDPADVARVLSGIVHPFVEEWMMRKSADRLTSRIPDLVRFFLHGISAPVPRKGKR